MDKYIIANRVAGKLTAERKKLVSDPVMKKLLGSDGILVEIEYQSGGTGSDGWSRETFNKKFKGRHFEKVSSKKGTSGFKVILSFALFPGESVYLPRVWEVTYEELINNKKIKVWVQAEAWNICEGMEVQLPSGEVAKVQRKDQSFPWTDTTAGRYMDNKLKIQVERGLNEQ